MRRGNTPQYKKIKELVPELTIAVQGELCGLSDRLLSRGLITDEGHAEFTNDRVNPHARASNLIRTVLNKIKFKARYYSAFVGALEENERLYESVLEKLKSNDDGIIIIDQPPLPPDSDREQSDSETRPFLRTPYMEYEDRCRQCHHSNRREYVPLDVACCSCYIGILLELMVIILMIHHYRHSSCNHKKYPLILLIVTMGITMVFLLNIACVFDKPKSCSKKACLLIVTTPWLVLTLFWFCAYQYMCTTWTIY